MIGMALIIVKDFRFFLCQSKRRSFKIVQNQLKTCQDVHKIEDMNYSVDQRGVIRNKGDLDSC